MTSRGRVREPVGPPLPPWVESRVEVVVEVVEVEVPVVVEPVDECLEVCPVLGPSVVLCRVRSSSCSAFPVAPTAHNGHIPEPYREPCRSSFPCLR